MSRRGPLRPHPAAAATTTTDGRHDGGLSPLESSCSSSRSSRRRSGRKMATIAAAEASGLISGLISRRNSMGMGNAGRTGGPIRGSSSRSGRAGFFGFKFMGGGGGAGESIGLLLLAGLLLVLVAGGDVVWADEQHGETTEPTTPEPFGYFDYDFNPSKRGPLKFGDRCESTTECGFAGSVCDATLRTCQCTSDLPATNHIDKCGKMAQVNGSCFFTEQCEQMTEQTECRDGRCICRFEMNPIFKPDGTVECRGTVNRPIVTERYVDPTMIAVLVAMAVMFIIICVVLRLFSKARWRDNRTIFNTPNPRLMNVSLLRDNKLLHGQERRGSRMSVRLPSRQPSMASLRPHSPNASIGKLGSRRGSRGSSNASATSTRSNRSQHAKDNGTAAHSTATNSHQNESVTVEIAEIRS
ncbi:uncharacterized protein LOC120424276 isoform X2 [Culex pipiens pallens]|uniref:uncharacterized protein LOC120424276 isoform X2 n=1 Tax=Culex pipiens pallens TaxID=42434 RepID=UPI0022AB1060|nr:uncharacterized protein LOC120424276 isoform X2 [Culex pipiens pallens]